MKSLPWALAALMLFAGVSACAETLTVVPEGPLSLSAALARARPGDTVEVRGGRHAGPLVIDRPLTLVGVDGPVIDGGGNGTVVRITAPDVTLRGFVVVGSGASLDAENAGITAEAPRTRVEGNRLQDALFGVYLKRAPDSAVLDNTIVGKPLPVPRRGDAIRVWHSDGVRISGNRVTRGRDVVLWFSSDLTVRDNTISHSRYGLHFMYCDRARIERNVLRDNSVGAFLMYSRRLHFERNLVAGSRGPSGYGIGLKDMDDHVVVANLFVDNRAGAYLDNSPREVDSRGRFERNAFAHNGTGVLLQPNVRRNAFADNSFIANDASAALNGGGTLRDNDWTGNHWSDYLGFDADGDGVGDVPYRAEALFDRLLERTPELRLFAGTPAAQALNAAARAFPVFKPEPLLTDPAPRMAPDFPAGVPTPESEESTGVGLGAGALGLLALGLGLFARPRSGAGNSVGAHGRAPLQEPTRLDAPPQASAMVRVEGLTCRFGPLKALGGVSLEVHAGESVALWGANGAGKTTLLRCLLGLLPFEGRVEAAGADVPRHGRQARSQIGFVPQEPGFYDDLTVRETLELFARLKRRAPEPDTAAQLALTGHLDKRVKALSGGLKQRLALAVALIGDPPLLLLDEPGANLDAAARDELVERLQGLKERGKTLVFASHRLDEVLALADRVVVLEQSRGRVLTASELVTACADTVRLHLAFSAEEVRLARDVLETHGILVRTAAGQRLVVETPRRDQTRPLALLHQEGVRVLDFRVAGSETSPRGEA